MITTTTPYITCWRGDIVAADFTLRVVSTATLQEYIFEGLSDNTPEEYIITLTPSPEEWSALTIGEYTYAIEVGGVTVAVGLLKYDGDSINTTEYNRDITYVEYNG